MSPNDNRYGGGLATEELAGLIAEKLPAISVNGFPVAGEPMVLPQQQYDELLAATAELLQLHLAAVKHLSVDLNGRLAALKADLAEFPRFSVDGISEQFEMAHAIDMARADVVLGPRGPQFIEFNVGGGFAGLVQFEVQRRLWREVGRVSGAPELSGSDPFRDLAKLILDTSSEHRAGHPVVILTSSDDSGRTPTELATQVAMLLEYGVHAELVDFRKLPPLDQLATPAPLGVVQFSEREAHDRGWDASRFIAAVRAGMVTIPAQSARLLDSKKIMALLSEGLPWMSARDRSLVNRYLPWTRIVGDREVTWRSQRRDLAQLLIDEQSAFVIKGSTGLSGKEVTFGVQCSPPQWRQFVAAALQSEYYVVQEVVESTRHRIRIIHDERGRSEVLLARSVVSPFYIGGVASGCHVRHDHGHNIGVLSRGTGAFPGCLLGAGFGG